MKDARAVDNYYTGAHRRNVHRLVQPLRVPAAALLVSAGESDRSIVRLGHNLDDAHLLWQTFSTNTRMGDIQEHLEDDVWHAVQKVHNSTMALCRQRPC